MRYVQWARFRFGRLLTVCLAVLAYFLLLILDGQYSFSQKIISDSPLFLTWARFSFSAFVALLFLSLGILVWLYARSRRIALLLFCFSFTMMATFTVETGAPLGDPLLSTVAGIGSTLSLSFFAILLLLFPRNYLSLNSISYTTLRNKLLPSRRYSSFLLLYGYLVTLALLSAIVLLHAIFHYLLSSQLSDWLNTVNHIYYLLVLVGILTTIITSYRQSPSLRERQQLRLFLGGVILSFAPLLAFTVLPLALGLPQYTLDSQLSTLTFIALPLALGYSILRYQLLVFDRYIRRVVAWMVSVVSLAVLGYLLVVIGRTLLPIATSDVFVVAAMVILVPCVWWLMHRMTDRLFFQETAYYRRLIEKPGLVAHETLNVDQAARLLTQAAVSVFDTEEIALFVLDEDTGRFQLAPSLKAEDLRDAPRSRAVQQLAQAVTSASNGEATIDAHVSLMSDVGVLDIHHPVFERVVSSKRPLLLSEAILSEAERPIGLSRYLTTASSASDMLLTTVRVQGKLIGILALGERGDQQPYAGPDFEVVELVLDRYSSLVETARLYELASRHVAILDSLYSATTALGATFQTVEEVAIAYAQIAANAVMAAAEIWWYDRKDAILRQVIHTGSGPRLLAQERLTALQESNWSAAAWFYEGDSPQAGQSPPSEAPACLPQVPCFPCAWLPLEHRQQRFGLLILTYPRPHRFSQEEKRVLGMFSSQYASALENAQKTIALRAAYERQKELDIMKDQFINTASHELRTPLTAVQGYIELLSDYGAALTPEQKTDFLAKAQRGCDELTLMVGNIMEVGRVDVEIENIRLNPLPLAPAVHQILEILEGITKREERAVRVDIPPGLHVMVDDLRLRQVLLNLIGNSLKYSDRGTAITIAATIKADEVTVGVRDYGLGVPPESQEHLFEHFVRLERDINSPVRGAGLGLYISRRLVAAMGGRIWVESTGQEGEGSIFHFTLKYADVAAEPRLFQHISRVV